MNGSHIRAREKPYPIPGVAALQYQAGRSCTGRRVAGPEETIPTGGIAGSYQELRGTIPTSSSGPYQPGVQAVVAVPYQEGTTPGVHCSDWLYITDWWDIHPHI
jgi:hypothetical protein